jgi:two-component system KDP operon response regulator KdpE
VRLTRTEFAILKALAESVDGVVTTRALLTTVWGPDGVDNVQSLRMHMSNLRSKVEEDTSEPRHVITEPGIGYRLVTEP